MTRRAATVVLLTVVAMLTVLIAPSHAAADERVVPRPLLRADFPDPAVVATAGGLVAYSTGERVPRAWARWERGAWHRSGPALERLPGWATRGHVWAVDVVRIAGAWLLYYSAPVGGITEDGRCIGVARSDHPRDGFVPVGDRPLVCPAYADTPRAEDPLLPRDRTLPRAGVIDPSVYLDTTGSAYLLYKTDRKPSSIRLLPLSANGRRARDRQVSQELLRSRGVVENPVLVAREQGYVLLTSEGDYTRCGYRTTWRRSPHLLDWSVIESGVLLDRVNTGLCGPGGADVVQPRGARQTMIFLHGWTCHERPLPCRGSRKWDHHRKRYRGIRSMYGTRLTWPGGLPEVAGWLGP